ncbi:unnamed protein product [Penicillium salamii]|uniref:SET domain-containing protein n=1 Tax=Penicillium salamii TaxID=1612424 RepID=A0A9W4JW25_9EURO|nr:unnamed protein product [Penicillium salamii]
MDSLKVVDLGECLRAFESIKPYLKMKAQAVKGLSANTQMSRDEILSKHMADEMMLAHTLVAPANIISAFLPPAFPPSTEPLGNLKKVLIKSLRFETHHRGQFLLLRTVTKAHRMVSVNAVVVEDESGSVGSMELFNHRKELSGSHSLREGTLLLLKEPYVEVMPDGDFSIRVDHLSDIWIVPEFDVLSPSFWRKGVTEGVENAFFWKEKGNQSSEQNDYRSAVHKALEANPPPELLIEGQCNRALAFLEIDRFDAALSDANNALKPPMLSGKALFGKAQALNQLRRFKESCETHAILAEMYPKDSLAALEYARTRVRLAEQESGEFDFKKMAEEAKNHSPLILDHSTYIDPVVVKKTLSHGRGLFTTKAVRAGDLLLCEKAFALAVHDEPKGNLWLFLSGDTDTATVGTQVMLIELIARRLLNNPSLLPGFLDLYHGSHESIDVLEVDGLPVIDTFLVENILRFNTFAYDTPPHTSQNECVTGDNGAPEENGANLYPTGIWSKASYINHSCQKNSEQSFIGDMMIVRATRDLPPNTEITIAYRSPVSYDLKNTPIDLKNWGFKCDWILCQDALNTNSDAMSTRNRTLSELDGLFKEPHIRFKAIKRKISKVEATYREPVSNVPRLALRSSWASLATAYGKCQKYEKAVETALKFFECLGFVIKGGKIPNVSGDPLVVEE